ncbi:MAG: enoyl-CoA hydratase/isomerase family protein, partial [Pseudomonadota bacterium]
MADTYETVLYEQKGATALITMNRPDAFNSFNTQHRSDLSAAMMRAAADSDIRAVVLNGSGRGFCAGADLKGARQKVRIEDVLNVEYAASLNIIMTMDKPVIAAVHGAAAGIGMTFALASDLLVMGEDAYLMAAFSNISLVPDGGLT